MSTTFESDAEESRSAALYAEDYYDETPSASDLAEEQDTEVEEPESGTVSPMRPGDPF